MSRPALENLQPAGVNEHANRGELPYEAAAGRARVLIFGCVLQDWRSRVTSQQRFPCEQPIILCRPASARRDVCNVGDVGASDLVVDTLMEGAARLATLLVCVDRDCQLQNTRNRDGSEDHCSRHTCTPTRHGSNPPFRHFTPGSR